MDRIVGLMSDEHNAYWPIYLFDRPYSLQTPVVSDQLRTNFVSSHKGP